MRVFSRLTISLGIVALLCVPGEAQINNSLYFMHGVPQSNRINPAHQPNCGFYIGLPGISPIRFDVSSSSLAYGDVIYPHPTQDSLITFLHPLGDKQAFLDLLKPVNFVASDLGTSLISFGFRTGIGFFSLDLTTRLDGNISYPGDLARLILNGAVEGETYQLDGIGADLFLLDEIALGWSGAILDNLYIGARAKLMFGIGSLTTTSSQLSVTTSQDVWNIQSDMTFNTSLPFAEVRYDSEGMIDEVVINDDLEDFDPSAIPGYGFNTNNFGLGVDLGVDYRPIEQLLVSASVVDIGYINWKDEVHEASYQMEFDFTGLEINPTEFTEDHNFGDYIDSTISQLGDSLSNFLTFTPGRAFSKRLNTKLFIGASYSVTPNINFGILSRTDFLSDQITEQVTASANFNTGRILNFTLSYSYLNDYFKNIGAGLSLNAGPLNLYLISDNALNMAFWPQETRSVNLWFGMNLVFGYKKFKGIDGDRPLLY
jgi:hypothetical protein